VSSVPKSIESQRPWPGYREITTRDGDALPEILARQSNPPQSTADIPFERYTSQSFFDLEMKKMWLKVWQFACREEHLREVGDYYVYDIGRHSILITRTESGLKAYHNSCLHRGTKLKPSGSSGWSASISCPFHGWTWNLDGTIKDIPCRWDFDHVQDADVHLPEVLIDSWNGFIFVNPDTGAKPLLEYLEVLPEHFRNWDLRGWYVHIHVRKKLPGNWKLGQEAFMEQYHTPTAHKEMTHVVGDWSAQHDIFSPHVNRSLCAMAIASPASQLNLSEQEMLDRMLVSDRSVVGERRLVPEGQSARQVMAAQLRETMNTEFNIDCQRYSDHELLDAVMYKVFPNLFIFPTIGLPLVQTFRPIDNDPDRCYYDQMILRPNPADGSPPPVADVIEIDENTSFTTIEGLDPFFAHVLDQDTNIMRWQREGMYASAKGCETLARYQEARIRHVHETLDKYLQA